MQRRLSNLSVSAEKALGYELSVGIGFLKLNIFHILVLLVDGSVGRGAVKQLPGGWELPFARKQFEPSIES